MSYQVLARKWRPQNFQQVIGQPHVLTALENGLSQNRVHHAYLFSGTRGVGKTTIARIFAKSLNCEDGVTATPCGECANCQAIDQGRFVDLLEIDAASRTKVDDTRELLDNVQYKPAQGRYKVYLIDEVHMLSKHSFNALLKTLEEPPEYVKFLLATTDPQKLPITVLSRCLQFHLKAILPAQIEQQLADILTHEEATFEAAALGVIAKAADGSMRDALSLTDQALAFGAGHIEYAAVLKMLGTIDHAHLHYLLHFIASGNSQKVFEKIQEFVHLGADFAALHQELASLCHQIALMQLQPAANVSNKTTVQLLAERLTPEEVQLFYQIALQGYKDYAYAPDGKIALEMTAMRLLAFKPANYIDIDDTVVKAVEHVDVPSVPLTAPVVQPVAATPVSAPSANEQAAQAPIKPEPVTVPAESVAAVTQPSVVPISTPPPVALQSPVPPVSVAQTPAAPVADANAEPSTLDTSSSRNMLRSHRLKREALKKTEAATEPSAPSRAQFVATDPQAIPAPVTSSRPLHNASPMVEEQTGAQELPPLTSYHADAMAYHSEQYGADADYFNEQPAAPLNKVTPATHPSTPVQTAHTATNVTTPLNHKNISAPQSDANVAASLSHDDISAPQSSANVATSLSYDDISVPQSDTSVTFVQDDSVAKPEIDIAHFVDAKMTDAWFKAIKTMQLVGFEKLLAKNTVKQVQGDVITLTLYAPQQHLLNNHALCADLKAKLRDFYGQQAIVNIEAGQVEGLHTPAELEVIVYQQCLDDAKLAIQNDPIVQTFVRDYAAKVYENSVVPL